MSKEWPPPPKLGRSAYLRPQYVVCRGLSMMREVLRLLVGLANFLRKLIPADAIAHPGAQLPFERFRPPIDPGPELIETLANSAGVDVEIPHGIAYATRVELQGPVQPPVIGRQPRLPGTGTVQVDGGPANQLDGDPRLGGSRRNPLRFGDDVGHRDAGLSCQLTAPARRR